MTRLNCICNLLMDTTAILALIHDKGMTKSQIQEFAKGRKINFVILDRIKTEWVNLELSMSPKYGDMPIHKDSLDWILAKYGAVEEIELQYNSKAYVIAERIYNDMKYRKMLTGDTLSRTDCQMLRCALDHDDWTLVTRDKLLIHAYQSERRIMCKPNNILVLKTGFDIKPRK